jgi:hypothetical protein
MGVWDISIDTENEEAEVFPLRHASFTGNQNFHAPPGMIKLENIVIDYDTGEIEADIGLVHLFPALKRYTGFDVMGVFMGDGNDVYPGDYNLAIHGLNDQRLLNADGYTRWFNANEFKGIGEIPPMFGYNPGHMGTPGYKPTADLNGYKYYAEGLEPDGDEFQFLIDNSDDRGMFVEGDLVWRHFSMIFPELPQTNEAKFQYAIIGHWEPNKHEPGPPVNVPDDFPPEANVDEAVVCDIQDSSTAWFENGESSGSVILDISPWDWSATCDAGTMGEYVIYVYSEAWTGAYEVDMSCLGLTDFYETFHAEIPVESLDSCEPLDVWVEVRYPGMDYSNKFGSPNYAEGELAGYFLVEVPISCDAPIFIEVITPNGGEEICWASDYEITWSSQHLTSLVNIEYSKDDFVSDINTIAENETNDGSFLWENIPIESTYNLKVRLSSVDFPFVHDESDDYFGIVEYGYGWARDWGGPLYDDALSVATDSAGNLYVTGLFSDTVDFDPGTGTDNHSSNGYSDAFLTKFDSSGNFIWARTWGGPWLDHGYSVAIDGSGIVYVTGDFAGVVDFDPSGNIDYHISNGNPDVFLCRYDSDGNYLWTRTWGGANYDLGWSTALDGFGNAYTMGFFMGTVDFDPSSGLDYHISNGVFDFYLSKFDSSGNFIWARTWGGPGSSDYFDWGASVAVDGSGKAYATGGFYNTVDFDPGVGVDNRTSNGDRDVFLTKYDSGGNYIWGRTWGGDLPPVLGPPGVLGFPGNRYYRSLRA